MKVGTTSRAKANETRTNQVVRKSIVQSSFRELLDYEKNDVLFRGRKKGRPPTFGSVAEIARAAESGKHPSWVVPADELERGRLLEVDVLLGAEPTFQISTVATALVDIMAGNQELFGIDSSEALDKGQAIAGVLNGLMGGLVPIVGRVVDYRRVRAEGSEWLVHASAIGHEIESEHVVLVGLCETGSFWRDIRRVLFSDDQYRTLCRVGRPGLRRDWNPVKLLDVLGTVAPEIAEDFQATAAAMANARTTPASAAIEGMEAALVLFAAAYAQELALDSSEDISRAGQIEVVLQTGGDFGLAENQRRAFDAIAATFEAESTVTSERAEALRASALDQSGWSPEGWAADSRPRTEPSSAEPVQIDVEIVAIYW
ncbi:MAG: hypothetical protein J7513_02235 [Solirubrobacteraceae bacterium]|nr:hypothetical protein [Solirubrobacteraceae bacterium]